jgi:hypothetical protein
MPDGSGDTQTGVTTSEPWKQVQPYLLGDQSRNIPGVLPEAANWYQSSNPQYYPGSTVAGFSPEQTAGLEAMYARGSEGSPLTAASSQYYQDVLGGKFTDAANPYFDQVKQAVYADVMPRYDAMASQAGMTGSPGHYGLVASNVANALAPYQYQAYNADMGRMMQAAGAAPGMAALDYQDIGAMLNAGGIRQGQAQQEINADIARYNFGQNLPLEKLQQYLALVGGNFGGTVTQAQPSTGPSAWQTGAGLGLAALGAVA